MKSLYLHYKQPKDRDFLSASQRVKFRRGADIGIFAHQLFPGGVNCAPSKANLQAGIDLTNKHIANKTEVIYEAAFLYENTYAALDILVCRDGEWHAYEVKSSVEISDTFMEDASFQYWLIKKCGLDLKSISIIYVNKDYCFENKLVPEEFFKIEDVTEKVLSMQEKIPANVESFKKTLSGGIPEKEVGIQCTYPYQCDFYQYCHKPLAKSNFTQVAGLSDYERYHHYALNPGSLKASDDSINFSKLTSISIQAHVNKKEVFQKNQIPETLIKKRSSILFFHAEIFRNLFPNKELPHPYQEKLISFASMDYDGNYVHHFASSDLDDFKDFLLHNIKSDTVLLVYKKQLKEILINLLPEQNEVFSIEELIEKGAYYHPKMGCDIGMESFAKVLNSKMFFRKGFPSDIVETQLYYMDVLNGVKGEKLEKILQKSEYLHQIYLEAMEIWLNKI